MAKLRFDELDIGIQECKGINNHPWAANPMGEINSDLARAATYVMMLRCPRCTTERFTYYDADMNMIAPHYYRYPKRYQSERIAPSEKRLALVTSGSSMLIRRMRTREKRRAS